MSEYLGYHADSIKICLLGGGTLRLAALILGIIGGIAGFGGALFALIIGGLDAAFSGSGTSPVIGLGVAAVLFSLIGLVGGALALKKPKAAGIMMLVSAVGGLVSISWGYVVAFPVFLIAGILALLSQKELETTTNI